MNPVPDIRRQQIFDVPRNRGTLKGLDRYPEKLKRKPWKELSVAVARQAYIISLSYPITRKQFGEPEGKDESELQ